MYTDCLSLLCALRSLHTRDEETDQLRRLFSRLSGRLSLFLFHVRGNSGLIGNEIENENARRTCTVGAIREKVLSKRVIWSEFQAESQKEWLVNWQTQHQGTETYKWLPNVLDLLPDFLPPKQATFLITGHGRFPFYLHRLSLITSPACFCGELSDIDHYMTRCPGTAAFRDRSRAEIRFEIEQCWYPRLLRNQTTIEAVMAMVKHINFYMPATD
ncbi:hypothetical protein HPB48_012155 [Haemaphysalis longicornis]|uniref:RNase H type-1 domain-containing protein n=1 Tax=Haemaphysalis longicornis TaxID=44386 RepID=A0A9J6FDZ8_HAELO|nr:hypothetical protein HPB48_012155 [Haemaphysalis longicornis]